MYQINSVKDAFKIFGLGALQGGTSEAVNQASELWDDYRNFNPIDNMPVGVGHQFRDGQRNPYDTENFLSMNPEFREVEGSYKEFLKELYEMGGKQDNFGYPVLKEHTDAEYNKYVNELGKNDRGEYYKLLDTFRGIVPTEVNPSTFLIKNGNNQINDPVVYPINEAPTNYNIKPSFSKYAIKSVSVPQPTKQVVINNPALPNASTYDSRGNYVQDFVTPSVDYRFSIATPIQQEQVNSIELDRLIAGFMNGENKNVISPMDDKGNRVKIKLIPKKQVIKEEVEMQKKVNKPVGEVDEKISDFMSGKTSKLETIMKDGAGTMTFTKTGKKPSLAPLNFKKTSAGQKFQFSAK